MPGNVHRAMASFDDKSFLFFSDDNRRLIKESLKDSHSGIADSPYRLIRLAITTVSQSPFTDNACLDPSP